MKGDLGPYSLDETGCKETIKKSYKSRKAHISQGLF
jgi:hypothetical protein